MTQEKTSRLELWEQPLEEEYWLALLQQGEHAAGVNPLDTEIGPPPGEKVGSGRGDLETEKEGSAESSESPLASTPSWNEAKVCLRTGDILRLPVVGYNRGGLLVDWKGWQGFVPASQLAAFPAHLEGEDRRRELASCVSQHLDLKIIELDQERNRLVFSEKATATQEDRIEQLLNDICAGDIKSGRVTNLCSFGAFVDLGGVEGLIHISELSWGRVAHPSDALRIGQEIEVYVLNVDRERRRIGLSLKRLQPDPWSEVEDRYVEGQLVHGVVTNVVSFGAFVRVEEGLEGLIHVSELAQGDFIHPRNVVKEGDDVTVRIMNIDSANHRLGLSLRRIDSGETFGWGKNASPV